ncbi:MAG: hypothetical protein BWY78_00686 [Alphaproteobacteria bacterium ADurb.Bin438]|nr:MAG: hypothetical protein BWY78_00686 [Alphaproteobacteria bacterium ADurb.Bin438]
MYQITLKKELLREFCAENCAFLISYINKNNVKEDDLLYNMYQDMVDIRNDIVGSKYQDEESLIEVMGVCKYFKKIIERLD